MEMEIISLCVLTCPHPNTQTHIQIRSAVIPSANGHFSARALAKFYAVLANHGQYKSFQLLRPETVSAMSTVCIGKKFILFF